MTVTTRSWSHGGPGLPTLTTDLRITTDGERLVGGERRDTLRSASGKVLRRWRRTLDDDAPLEGPNCEQMVAWRAACDAHLAGRSKRDELTAWRRACEIDDQRRAHRAALVERRSTCLRRAVETTAACARKRATARSTGLPVRPVRRLLRRSPRAPDDQRPAPRRTCRRANPPNKPTERKANL